jgi:HAD superfamily hydrolase (TIGR01549 family)
MKLDTLFLDAGGVLCHPNWSRVSAALADVGVVVSADALQRAEPHAKKEIDDAVIVGGTTDASRGWLYFDKILAHAGIARSSATDAALTTLREYHRAENLWETVHDEVRPALVALRGLKLTLVVVSNANGRLRHLFDRVGLTPFFDVVLDSHEWGVEKPDPRLFKLAMEQSRADPSRTVHVGDLYHVDVVGARNAGLREGVLFDMADLYDNVDCPRVGSLAALVEWIDKPSGNQTRNRVP